IGMLSSATIGGKVGLYEPVHGSAPDIAGSGKANPLGAIESAALAFRNSFGLEAEARRIQSAIAAVVSSGLRTADLSADKYATTSQVGDAVCEAIASQSHARHA
ncbi:MAG TPA: isocitrate/isopropylmalate family dehydrogenase, partial [Blastocatellia bacterium]